MKYSFRKLPGNTAPFHTQPISPCHVNDELLPDAVSEGGPPSFLLAPALTMPSPHGGQLTPHWLTSPDEAGPEQREQEIPQADDRGSRKRGVVSVTLKLNFCISTIFAILHHGHKPLVGSSFACAIGSHQVIANRFRMWGVRWRWKGILYYVCFSQVSE